MKRIIFVFSLLIFACSGEEKVDQHDPNKIKLDKIAALESRVYDDATSVVLSDMNELMLSYQEYANANSKDSLAPEYYFKAGQLAYSMGKYRHSLDLNEKVIGSYPDYDKNPSAMFLMALIHHYQLKDEDAALTVYQRIIELYPESVEAKDAESSIGLIGLSDEQIIDKFKKQNEDPS